MRREEVLSLTWDQVDLKKREIDLKADETKTGEPRTIPICKELHMVLKSIPRNLKDNHVFLYRGKPLTYIQKALGRACAKVGIPYGRFKRDGFVFHDLRRTFNTHMRKAGVPESVIMKITGHKTRIMFDRYNVVDEDDKREAVNRMGAYLQDVNQTVNHEADKPG
jgi:integrase